LPLADQRRAGNTIARPQIDAIEHWCDMLGAGGPHDDLVHSDAQFAQLARDGVRC
jgi:hypothetical protein